jgi:DNA-binding SARP family transcriptional activator
VLDFRILGSLEVYEGGRVPIRQGKQRALLAVLLLHANELVPTDRLIDELWGIDAPATARNTLQVYVSRLRKALGSPELLVSQPPGYVLRLQPEQLDLHRFEHLVDEGRRTLAAGNPQAAADALHAGLALWRGRALADFAHEPFAEKAAARLEEARLAAIETRIEAELALGLHQPLVGELRELVAEYPRRERLRGALMLALYRSERQEEALQVFQETRRELVEKLGIEPNPELQGLVKAILRQDPALVAPRPQKRGAQTRRNVMRLELAARRAHDRGDAAAAVALFSRCTAMVPAHDPVRIELLPELAEALFDTGDFERSSRVAGEALTTAEVASMPDVVWHARLVLLSLRIAVDANVRFDHVDREVEEAIGAFERLGDEKGLSRAWFARTAIPWRLGQAGEAMEALEQAREYARRAGDERMQVRSAILFLGAALMGPTHVREGIRLCEAALDAHGDRPRVVGAALRALAWFKAMAGDFADARTLVERDRPILRELGLTVHAAYVSEIYAGVELLAGDAAAAELEVRHGYDTLAALGEKTALSTIAAVLAETLYLQGRADEAVRFTDVSRRAAAAQDFTAQVQWRGPQAKILADQGFARDAERLAREAVSLSEGTDWLNLRGNALCDLAHVLARARRPREAGEAIRRARELYEQKGNLIAADRARHSSSRGVQRRVRSAAG